MLFVLKFILFVYKQSNNRFVKKILPISNNEVLSAYKIIFEFLIEGIIPFINITNNSGPKTLLGLFYVCLCSELRINIDQVTRSRGKGTQEFRPSINLLSPEKMYGQGQYTICVIFKRLVHKWGFILVLHSLMVGHSLSEIV